MSNPRPEPGRIALRAAADALANVGVHEVGENAGKFVETYLRSVGLEAGAPWCAAFVHYRLAAAAKALGLSVPDDMPCSGYCPSWQAWGKKRGWWIPVADVKAGKATVQKGDLVLFYFPAKSRVAHIGIVTGVESDGAAIRTVEGNTSDGTGVNRDGDGVYARRRYLSALGIFGGFVRLPF